MFLTISSLFCELDFQHIDIFSENFNPPLTGKNLIKNDNRFLLITSFGVELYETSEDELAEVASYDFPMVFWADLYGDTMVLIFNNIDGDPYCRDIVNIYDISNIEEPQLIHQIEANLYQAYLRNNVIILGDRKSVV